MTPEELSRRHPRLYHVTEASAWPGIREHGLLSTSRLLDLFEIKGAERTRLELERRATEEPLKHQRLESVVLNDQIPLSHAKLKRCLDDNLTPPDWLQILNARVFFWVDKKRLNSMLAARTKRGRSSEVLIFETLGLVQSYFSRIEICPINSGSTIHRPTRRGSETFTPLASLSYFDWARKRGLSRPDRIAEVTLKDGAENAADYVLERRRIPSNV